MSQPLLPDDPREVGGYSLEGRLGAGGQGVVYLGRAADGTAVAVKVLHQDWADDETRKRLVREITAARRVAPFCVAQVLDADVDADRPYVVSEYVEGPSLQQAGARSGSALHRLAVTTATALAAVHQAGVVHRDFKPANVLLGADGPRVIDFGIARHLDSATKSGGLVGTPAYMSPEQIAGAQAGPASDVFAWGCVIVFAATGRPPFGDDSVPAVINRVMSREPDLGDLAEPLRSIVADALRKDPAERPSILDIQMRLLGRPVETESPAAPVAPMSPVSTPHVHTPPAHVPPPGSSMGGVPAPGHGPYVPVSGTFASGGTVGAAPSAGAPTQPSRYGSRRRGALLTGTGAATLAVAVVAGVLVWQGAGTGESGQPVDRTQQTTGPDTTQRETAQPETTRPTTVPVTTSPFPTPAPRAASRFPAAYVGVWRGRVNYDPGAYDRLVVTIRKGGRTATDQHLDSRCTGTSRLVKITDSIAHLKRMTMRGNCPRNGEIYLTLNEDGTLGFEYAGHGENKWTRDEPWFMHATLKRDR
ncbi:serine/threonine protein kinase [Microtetraspora glauca]|uniref:Protein kinase n=1 Tax=Microtetraspora glauca TaxID=1996 RepID=A0ABV3GUB4_MICGL